MLSKYIKDVWQSLLNSNAILISPRIHDELDDHFNTNENDSEDSETYLETLQEDIVLTKQLPDSLNSKGYWVGYLSGMRIPKIIFTEGVTFYYIEGGGTIEVPFKKVKAYVDGYEKVINVR